MEGILKIKNKQYILRSFIISFMPEILPVRNGNNHWHSLTFKDNGVGSQSSFINPFPVKTFQLSINAGCHWSSSPPVKLHYIKYPQSKIWAVGGGWGETKKGFLHLIIRDSQRQNDNKNANYCGGFLSTTSYTRSDYISRMVEKEQSPVCDISLQSKFSGCPQGEGCEEIWNYCPIMRRVNKYPSALVTSLRRNAPDGGLHVQLPK